MRSTPEKWMGSLLKKQKETPVISIQRIEPMQLIFNKISFDIEVKQSGLLNSLSNPYSQVQTQFCSIHLTIQELLAAKHVVKSFHPEEIKEFISSHINSGKWRLVLQFIAGLLGKEIKILKKRLLQGQGLCFGICRKLCVNIWGRCVLWCWELYVIA